MSQRIKAKIENKNPQRAYYFLQPWRCEHHEDKSELLAYVEASGEWETAAVIPPTSGASPENLAGFITALINDNQKNKDLLHAAIDALQHIVEDNGLTFSSEQAVDSVLIRFRKTIIELG